MEASLALMLAEGNVSEKWTEWGCAVTKRLRTVLPKRIVELGTGKSLYVTNGTRQRGERGERGAQEIGSQRKIEEKKSAKI